jgi:DNA-binding transcriptional MerR regulator
MSHIQITEAAARLRISTRTIRFYEEKGLLSPAKTPHNGYRLYSGQDLLRLQTIIALRETGLSLSDLQTVLETYGMEQPEELLYLLELQRSLLYAKRQDLDGQIRMNEQLIGSLERDGALSPGILFGQAEDSRRERDLRSGWRDMYRFDLQAEVFDAKLQAGSPEYPGYEETLRLLVRELNPRSGELGLDVGTGTGNLAGAMLESGVHMKAVDQSKEMLRVCRRKFPLMETKLGNVLSLPFFEGTFDLVVSSYVFHRLDGGQRLSALREIIRVLKPHGRFGLACPLTEDEWAPLLERLHADGYMTKLQSAGAGVTALLAVPLHKAP